MSALKPLADRVLIEPTPAEEKTASGIIIPDAAKVKPLRGTVVAVGNGKKDEPMTVKEGDTRSEERRVGKECRGRWSARHHKQRRQKSEGVRHPVQQVE